MSESVAVNIVQIKNHGLLRNTRFDTVFIFGVAAVALLSGGLVILKPNLFGLILFLDIWILGYQHVVATFTRLSFDMESFKEHKHLVTWLPIVVAVATVATCMILGPWVLATTYLYWQWFHYTRQSYGIARVYQCKFDPKVYKIDQLIVYVLPLAGIMYRSYQKTPQFLGMDIKYIPVTAHMVQGIMILSAIVLFWWVGRQLIALKEKKTSIPYTLFMLSHVIIFTVGYIVVKDINFGWLIINIWHNAQYVMFVWLFNNKRFNNKSHSQHKFLSTLSSEQNQLRYYMTCLAISTIAYFALERIIGYFHTATLPLALVVYQTINFHHYVVDGIIWKVRKKPMRKTLDLVDLN